MTAEDKLEICIMALRLMCKPANLITNEEITFLDGTVGEDQLAFDTLDMIDERPEWERPTVPPEEPYLYLVK